MSDKGLVVDISAIIGEGVHTSLRKFTNSMDAHNAWVSIGKMPDDEWGLVCDIVAKEIVEYMNNQSSEAGKVGNDVKSTRH